MKQQRKTANNAINIIKNYKRYDLISIQGEESDSFADNLFLAVFTKFRMKYDLCLITQDLGLSEDILKLNKKSSSVNRGIKRIIVARISDRKHELKVYKRNPKPYVKRSEKNYHQNKIIKFKIYDKPINPNKSSMKCSKIPVTNDFVKSKKFKNIQLIQEISKGGEGIVYLTNNDLVCKIYKKNKLKQNKYDKLKLMVNNPINRKGICWPKDLIYNENDEFVGFLMDKASGYELQKSVFLPMLLRKKFPYWNRYNLVKLSKTILSQISYLHSRNVIIGDINPFNILVKSENEIYFIDTDSFQIENYPCPVGTINFTAPEIQGKNYKTFLRTFAHENFAVATLLFMILLPGKPPFSQQGGANPASNIRRQDFSYPLGDNSNKKTPPGQWRYIWSNLPYKLKEAFYYTFKGKYRLKVFEWSKILNSGLIVKKGC